MDAVTQQQKGTFVTDGNLVNGAAPAGTYTISDFTVTNTTTSLPITGSFASGEWTIGMPTFGFIWDGTIPTQFWRAGGDWTNGFSYSRNNPGPDFSNYIIFGVDYFSISNYNNDTTEVYQPITILLAVVQPPKITLTGNTTVEGTLNIVGLPVFENNSAAIIGGLTEGAFYRTSSGFLMVVYTPIPN